MDHFYIGISITYVFVVLFRPARQLLGHKNLKTTTQFYAGFDTRRAGLHHQRLILHKRTYCSESGISPTFKITGAAAGDERKRISALAASGCVAELVTAPAKKTLG